MCIGHFILIKVVRVRKHSVYWFQFKSYNVTTTTGLQSELIFGNIWLAFGLVKNGCVLKRYRHITKTTICDYEYRADFYILLAYSYYLRQAPVTCIKLHTACV